MTAISILPTVPAIERDLSADREALAKRVADAFGQAFAKLAAHKSDIEQLWVEFENLPADETIMGCTTKGEFCQKVLGRSSRAVQYMLTGGNPSNRKAPVAKPSEIISHQPSDETADDTVADTADPLHFTNTPAIEVPFTTSEPTDVLTPSAASTSLRFELCSRTDPRYEEIRDRHYIDNKGCIGRQVHFLIWYKGQIVGVISGASAAYATAPRDKFFGITEENRQAIQGIINNVVFRLELDEPNLATRCLRRFQEIIPHIFYEMYGVVVFGFETFVLENDTRVGTIYKADNWTFAGATAGSTKVRNGIENPADRKTVKPKLVFCKWRDGFHAPCTTRTPKWVMKEYPPNAKVPTAPEQTDRQPPTEPPTPTVPPTDPLKPQSETDPAWSYYPWNGEFAVFHTDCPSSIAEIFMNEHDAEQYCSELNAELNAVT